MVRRSGAGDNAPRMAGQRTAMSVSSGQAGGGGAIGARSAPLAPALTQTFLNSLGTGAITNGVFFVTKQAYGFSELQNYLLALVMGATYVAAALTIGPAIARLIARSPRATHRGALVALTLGLAGACSAPMLDARPWTIWLFVAVYAPLTGALWPIIEGYISGGRRAGALRRAIGAFNLSWASAVAAAYWLMAPFRAADRPLLIIAALGGIHLLCALLALALPASPGGRVDEAHEPHPPVYVGLLVVFRWLLLLSYVLLYAISPLLPARLTSLAVDLAWQTPMASAWMATRVAVFALLQVWAGWHGRWRTPAWSGGAMLAGFALFVLAPDAATLTLALALFGVGIGGVYAAALYYAMEVGAGAVHAGGKHEALIGGGYTIGPLSGVAAWSAVSAGAIGASAAPRLMLGVVFVIAGLVAGVAARSAIRALRAERRIGRMATEGA